MQTLYKIIEQSAFSGMSYQRPDGSMPPGNNGPYNDPETPVRNTSHWLITFIKAYEINGDKRFYSAAERAVSYLTSADARPMQASFWCRKNPHKDFSNGLVGQAWVIEALVNAARQFSREDLIQLAERVFLLHPYDSDRSGWVKVNVDGSYRGIDSTLNHQIWFAAAGALISQVHTSPLTSNVDKFMDRLSNYLGIYPSGLIKHVPASFPKSKLPLGIGVIARSLYGFQNRSYMKMKSVGYHGFNMYGLSLLKTTLPEHNFWKTPKFKRALAYPETEKFKIVLNKSKYGYPYNPPGFEIAYMIEVFKKHVKAEQEIWLSEQFRRSYDYNVHLMNRGTDDPWTLAARLYEATRLPDLPIYVDPVE